MRLRTGYITAGITIGFTVCCSFFLSLPDGKLRIYFCDVGQGDGAYIRFPDGKDMIVDGGPNDDIINCLGKYMPFWDRHIDLVLMTHPQKDHMQGLLAVIQRYQIDYFLRSDIDNPTEGFEQLQSLLQSRHIPVRLVEKGEQIHVGKTVLSILWPSENQIAKAPKNSAVLGAQTDKEINDFAIVFLLQYGTFDALFTGDADSHVEADYEDQLLAFNSIDLLKVPHHGSRTGMTERFLQMVHPSLAVISVGKNSYGHPTAEALQLLEKFHATIARTDKLGDVEVISDGSTWSQVNHPKPKFTRK